MIDDYHAHAWLYDAAFSWDNSDEVGWLREQLGTGISSLLEPCCGSGRLLEGFTGLGIHLTGIDSSPEMLARAKKRFEEAGLPLPQLIEADARDFGALDLGALFEAAVLPIGTFALFTTPAFAASHLNSVACHLRPGARYMIQLELTDLANHEPRKPGPTTRWDTPHQRGTVRTSVFGTSFDPFTRIELTTSRYELLDGPEAGFVHESIHPCLLWDFAAWKCLIDASPFTQVAAWDASTRNRVTTPVDASLEDQLLTWHVLVKD